MLLPKVAVAEEAAPRGEGGGRRRREYLGADHGALVQEAGGEQAGEHVEARGRQQVTHVLADQVDNTLQHIVIINSNTLTLTVTHHFLQPSIILTWWGDTPAVYGSRHARPTSCSATLVVVVVAVLIIPI